MSLRDSYKKPQINNSTSTFKKPFPIVDGRTFFRLVPPLAEIAPSGKWHEVYSIHFGYKALNPKTEQPSIRTFICPRVVNNQTKEVVVACPECDLIEQRKAELEEMNHANKDLTPEELVDLTLEARSFLDSHNRTTKAYVHVMNKEGEFGYMTLPISALGKLKDKLRELDSTGVDAFDPNSGVWLYVEKKGAGRFNTSYDVGVEQEVIMSNGRRVSTDKVAPLSESQLEQALRDCPLFSTLVNVVPVSVIKQLTVSDMSPEVVSKILTPVKKEVQSNVTVKAATEALEQLPVAQPELPRNNVKSRSELFLKEFGFDDESEVEA